MQWISLTDSSQLNDIVEASTTKAQIILKHSTRCSISHMAKGRLDRSPEIDEADCYYLDLIMYRDISNEIAERFNVHHESPQILLIKNGECTYAESHSGIIFEEIQEQVLT